MTNGWTGGQYSIYRVILSLWLLWLSIAAFVAAEHAITRAVAIAAVAAITLLALGVWDRIAAIVLALLLAVAGGMQMQYLQPAAFAELLTHPALLGKAILILLLIFHAAVPSAPYGSLPARGRQDPRGQWHMPGIVHTLAWCILAIGCILAGLILLMTDSQWRNGDALATILQWNTSSDLLRAGTWLILGIYLAFGFVSPAGKIRPWAWLILLITQITLAVTLPTHGLMPAAILLQLFAFNPAWIAPRRTMTLETAVDDLDDAASIHEPEFLFYDGHCGLCHRCIRFVLSEDRSGETFQFAPLQSTAFEKQVPAARRANLPDSVIILTQDGSLLSRSDAIGYMLQRLGGLWRPLGAVLRSLPAFVRNGGYDLVARIRHRIFARPKDACPMMPPDLRQRFKF